DEVIGVSQAGPSVQAGPIGEWSPDDDRRTRLVFIGSEMDEVRIRGELDDLAAADADGETRVNEETRGNGETATVEETAAEAFPL
ncbi:GTP-binding protein, partial [Halorubrum pallidum]